MSSLLEQDEDPFLITAELEIRSILRSVQRHAVLLRMYIQGNPDQSIMTTILAFDDEAGHVIVDCASEPELNERLVKAQAVVFDTQVDHVNVHFTARHLESTSHDGHPALAFPYPESLRRIQRREYYRVEIPVGEPVSCMLTIAEQGQAPRRVALRLRDISAGGLALLDTDNSVPHQSGMVFRNARLTLPEVGEVTVDLSILRVHTIVLPNKKEIIELGCSFVDASNATTMQVQNYIGRLERRLNAKRRGF